MDYDAIGLVSGLEIHQQLDTRTKLFCGCPTAVRPVEEHDGEFCRYLRATASELGEIDRAAEEEMKQVRRFRYLAYDTTCLVENDDEPPSPLNEEALEVTLEAARTFGMTPIEQVHVMRKLVIDGSNTSGFQRTALVAVGGVLPNGGVVESICLEEEAAQRVEDACFSLDRLGIPLVEITTSPCLHSPEEVRDTAAYIGMVLRSTGKVKRGIGTIRQDLNVSIRDGARVEIKGVQELDLIAEVVRREVARQQGLLAIRAELEARGASVEDEAVDVTNLFKGDEVRGPEEGPGRARPPPPRLCRARRARAPAGPAARLRVLGLRQEVRGRRDLPHGRAPGLRRDRGRGGRAPPGPRRGRGGLRGARRGHAPEGRVRGPAGGPAGPARVRGGARGDAEDARGRARARTCARSRARPGCTPRPTSSPWRSRPSGGPRCACPSS